MSVTHIIYNSIAVYEPIFKIPSLASLRCCCIDGDERFEAFELDDCLGDSVKEGCNVLIFVLLALPEFVLEVC